MKTLTIICILIFGSLASYAQGIAINETGAAPDPSSLLDISSTTKGLLIHRMRTIERIDRKSVV